MSATTALPPDVAAYLASVREALRDLPPAERDDLLAEVEVSLLDAASEGGPIAPRLGPPEEFAAELRAAAGLEQPVVASRGEHALRRIRRAGGDWWKGERAAVVRRTARELAPIWWVVRGYVAVAAVALATEAEWSTLFPVVPRLGSGEAGLAVVAAAVVASVVLGLRSRRGERPRPLLLAANVALALAAVPVADHVGNALGDRTEIVHVAVPAPAQPGLANDGVPVDNIYPYSRDGELLHDVFLYDGTGAPLNVRPQTVDPDRRVPAAVNGVLLYNVFPIRYYEPGTAHVADPDAGPPVAVPRLKTPPLRGESTP